MKYTGNLTRPGGNPSLNLTSRTTFTTRITHPQVSRSPLNTQSAAVFKIRDPHIPTNLNKSQLLQSMFSSKDFLDPQSTQRCNTQPNALVFKLPEEIPRLDKKLNPDLDERLIQNINSGIETLESLRSKRSICDERREYLEMMNWLNTCLRCLSEIPAAEKTKEETFDYLSNAYNSCMRQLVSNTKRYSNEKAAVLDLVWRNLLALQSWTEQYYKDRLSQQTAHYLLKSQQESQKYESIVSGLSEKLQELQQAKQTKQKYFYEIVKDNRILRSRNKKLMSRLKHQIDSNYYLKQENVSYYKQNEKFKMVLSGEDIQQYATFLEKCQKFEKSFLDKKKLSHNSLNREINKACLSSKIEYDPQINNIVQKMEDEELLEIEYFEPPKEIARAPHYSCSVQTYIQTENRGTNTFNMVWLKNQEVQVTPEPQKNFTVLTHLNMKIYGNTNEENDTLISSRRLILSKMMNVNPEMASKRSSSRRLSYQVSRESIAVSKARLPMLINSTGSNFLEPKTYEERVQKIQQMYDGIMKTLDALKILQVGLPNHEKPRMKKQLAPIVAGFIVQANKVAQLAGDKGHHKRKSSNQPRHKNDIRNDTKNEQETIIKKRKVSIEVRTSITLTQRKSSTMTIASALKLKQNLDKKLLTESDATNLSAPQPLLRKKSSKGHNQAGEVASLKAAENISKQDHNKSKQQKNLKVLTDELAKRTQNAKERSALLKRTSNRIKEGQGNNDDKMFPIQLRKNSLDKEKNILEDRRNSDESCSKQSLETIQEMLTAKEIDQSPNGSLNYLKLRKTQDTQRSLDSKSSSSQEEDKAPSLLKMNNIEKRTSINTHKTRITTAFQSKEDLISFFKKANQNIIKKKDPPKPVCTVFKASEAKDSSSNPRNTNLDNKSSMLSFSKIVQARQRLSIRRVTQSKQIAEAISKVMKQGAGNELITDIDQLFGKFEDELIAKKELEMTRSGDGLKYPLNTVKAFIRFVNKEIIKNADTLLQRDITYDKFFEKRVMYRYGLEDMSHNIFIKFKESLDNYALESTEIKVIARLLGCPYVHRLTSSYYLKDLFKIYIMALELLVPVALDDSLNLDKAQTIASIENLLKGIASKQALDDFVRRLSYSDSDKSQRINFYELFLKIDGLLSSLSSNQEINQVVGCLGQLLESTEYLKAKQLTALASIIEEDRNKLHMNTLKLVPYFHPAKSHSEVRSPVEISNNKKYRILPVSRLAMLSKKFSWQCMITPVQSISSRYRKYFGQAPLDPKAILAYWQQQYTVLRKSFPKIQRLLALLNSRLVKRSFQIKDQPFPGLLYKLVKVAASNEMETIFQNKLIDERLLMFPACTLKIECSTPLDDDI